MSITGILFLFFFLPLSLALYYLVDDRAKEYVLLAVSFVFYAAGSRTYILLFAAATILTVAAGRALCAVRKPLLKRLFLFAGILLNLSLLGYYKYADFLLVNWSAVSGRAVGLRDLALPLGISFFTFKAISYLVDVFRDPSLLSPSPIHDALYLSFFAQIQCGPLTRYGEMRLCPNGGAEDRGAMFSRGVYRFVTGFSKKILLANMLGRISEEVFGAPPSGYSCAYMWLGSICYSLELYYDFSAYSDMAVGLSNMFGFPCAENFNYPYMTESISRFWRRWHISLGQWFRDYVYIPLGGSRGVSRGRILFNLFVVWFLTGLWHGAAWTFILWGLGYFVLIAFEKTTGLPDRLKSGWSRALCRIFTLLFINCQWVLFRSETVSAALAFLRRLFVCEANPLADVRTVFLMREYGVFLIAALVFVFPVVPWLEKRLAGHRRACLICEGALVAAAFVMFVWSLSFVVAGQNNPFAYANF